MNYEKRLSTLGPERGECNACGNHGALTADHVPPKGVPGVSTFNLYRLSDAMNLQAAAPRQVQNGVKYRTLCSICNNTRLGARYDPSLVEFVSTVADKMRELQNQPRQFSRKIFVRTKPARIIRSVIGHVLAIKVRRESDEEGIATTAMKKYFVDDGADLPPELNCFVWLYPAQRRVNVRVAMRSNLNDERFMFSLLKFFPCAFMLTWRTSPDDVEPVLDRISERRRYGLDEEHDVVVSLRPPPLEWPEFPVGDDGSVIMHCDGAHMAVPKDKRN